MKVDIMILGAGYAGMAAAKELCKKGIEFTLINKHTYHYFTTLMHEAAGGRNDFHNYEEEIEQVLDTSCCHFIKDEIEKIHPEEKKVIGKNQTYEYKYLICGLGSVPSYFGIPGLKENSLVLNSLNTAKKIKEQITSNLLMYKKTLEEEYLRVIVGGGGLTGIELISELSNWIPQFAIKNEIPVQKIELINIEAMPTILPMLDLSLRNKVIEVLEKQHVRFLIEHKIIKVEPNVVYLKSGEEEKELHAKTIIWTGGVQANPILEKSGFSCDGRGRVFVNRFLTAEDYPEVYILGDNACYIDPDDEQKKPLPPTGQLAEQMGKYAAETLVSTLHEEKVSPFVFHNLGTAASIGPKYGVAQVKKMKLKGKSAVLIKEGSKLKYLMHLGGSKLIVKKIGQFIR